MSEMDKVLSDCDYLRRELTRIAGNEATDLRHRLLAEIAAYDATIPSSVGSIDDRLDAERMHRYMECLEDVQRQLDILTSVESDFASAVTRAMGGRR